MDIMSPLNSNTGTRRRTALEPPHSIHRGEYTTSMRRAGQCNTHDSRLAREVAHRIYACIPAGICNVQRHADYSDKFKRRDGKVKQSTASPNKPNQAICKTCARKLLYNNPPSSSSPPASHLTLPCRCNISYGFWITRKITSWRIKARPP